MTLLLVKMCSTYNNIIIGKLVLMIVKKDSNYSGTLNKSTNIDFGHRDLSNKGFIAKLKMTSGVINL